MISTNARPYIAASVLVLREHGLAITQHFYGSMLAAHPELNNVFNLGNQANGAQQQSLASAVFAYAANIDNAAALAPVLERIAHKHAAVGVKPAHYPIVGRHLLGAIQAVLGDAATPALLAAWDEAYWLLAGELIAAEARLYLRAGQEPGALRELVITRATPEADDAVSYYLSLPEGGSPGAFLPGQYLSVAVDFQAEGLRQLRQYSLSSAPGDAHWRITVRREDAQGGAPAGRVSSHIHSQWREGTRVLTSRAFGCFTLPGTLDGPLVFVTAGAGITPVASMLHALTERPHLPALLHLHAARDGRHAPLSRELRALRLSLPQLSSFTTFEAPTETDVLGQDYDAVGRLELATLGAERFRAAEVFLCGPSAFMAEQWRALRALDVPAHHIHRELFGPDALSHLL